jgi:putative ABC transport system permease protein
MERLVQDLRHAVRVLRKTPVFTLVVIFTLAVGIGANTAMFSVVNAVLLEGLPFRDPSRVVDINEYNEGRPTAIAPANFVDWRAMSRSFESMAVYARRTFNVATGSGEPERLPGTITSSTFFDVLGVSPILGRAFTPQDAEPGQSPLILSYSLWQRRFAGAADVVNRVVRLNGQPYTIVGVMPAGFNFPQEAEFWTASANDLPPGGGPGDPRENRGGHYLRGVARLATGVSLEQANAELTIISDQLQSQYPDTNSNFTARAASLQQQLVGASRTPLLILLAAVGCVLLIVIANVANLLMARATVRARELAIRAAVGANRQTLVRQLLTESVVMAVVGGALGVLLAFWGVDLILALDPGEVPRVTPIAVNGKALGFAVLISVVTGILFGAGPAWQASKPELQNTLKESTRGTTGEGSRQLARQGLVLAEVSISLVLLVGAGLLFRSLVTLMNVPLGFTSAGAITLQVSPTGETYRAPGHFVSYWERLLDNVRAVPGVQSAALTGTVPMGQGMSILAFNVAGRPLLPLNQQPVSHLIDASPEYFATLGIPVLKGREFSRQDAVVSPRVVIVNDAFARREFPNQDPIGQRVSFGPDRDGNEQWLDIIGVVANVRQYRPDEAPVPIMYVIHTFTPQRAFNLIVRADGDATALASAVRAAVQAIDPSLPVSRIRTLDDVIGASLAQRRFNMSLLLVFAGIALVLAIAGIYGTVAYAVAQRTQEIGIRVALGATAREILRLVLLDALKPVAGGLVLGIVAALALTRALERMVYGVSTTDAVTFVSLPLLLALVAMIASWLPALRATRVDPMVALRMD